MSINLSFLVTWTTSIISSIGPMACLLSMGCWANFDLFLYLKSRRCSWNLTLDGRPVCPVETAACSGLCNREEGLLGSDVILES